MEPEDLEIIPLELKYCERCGGLWLRPAGTDDIYCAACERSMAELPAAEYTVRKRRTKAEMSLDIEGRNGEILVVFCGKGGNA